MGNHDLADRMRAFAAVLDKYDHLPPLDFAQVATSSRVIAGTYADDPARVAGVWAEAFGATVRIVVYARRDATVNVAIQVSGWLVKFRESIPMEVAARLPHRADVDAAVFLAALDAAKPAVDVAS